jgi:hypothetical protein
VLDASLKASAVTQKLRVVAIAILEVFIRAVRSKVGAGELEIRCIVLGGGVDEAEGDIFDVTAVTVF